MKTILAVAIFATLAPAFAEAGVVCKKSGEQTGAIKLRQVGGWAQPGRLRALPAVGFALAPEQEFAIRTKRRDEVGWPVIPTATWPQISSAASG